MKTKIPFFLLLFMSVNLYASSDEGGSYEFNFQPKIDLTYKTSGYLKYGYTGALSSKFYFMHETYNLEEEIDDFPGSKRVEDTAETVLDFYFIEYSSSFFSNRLKTTFGAALDIFIQGTDETGDFTFGAVSQKSENSYDVIFYSAKLEMKNLYRDSSFAVVHNIEYVPVYYYSFSQKMSILPLVPSGEMENSYTGTCYPYFKNDLKIVFHYFELQGIHEYQKINFKLLNLAPDGGGFKFFPKTSSFYISNFTFFVNARIPVFETLDLVVGAGKKIEQTYSLDTDKYVRDRSQWILNFGVTDRLLM